MAQLVEQLICNQQVVGSNPSAGSSLAWDKTQPLRAYCAKDVDSGLSMEPVMLAGEYLAVQKHL
jgi:hypothetical protein